MAALRYRDEHNKVGYLLKPTGSDDYHHIIDFLRASHIRYALTHNPVIFDSLVKQLWSTAMLNGGEGAGVAAQAVPQHMPALDQPQDHLSTPSRQQTFDLTAPVFEQEDEPLGGSFHMSPPRSTQAPLAGQTSGGVEDLITLTALSSIVSTLVHNVNTLETELKDHKKLFKDVVGKLVKKVKAMEVKLRISKRKMVVSDSDQEERGKQDVDLDALLVLANATVTVDSNISPGGASDNIAASTSVPADVLTSVNVPTGSTSVPADVPTSVAYAEDRLGKHAAKRLHDEEQAQVDKQRAELQRRRQQKVLASAMYYIKADWINIMAQVEVNASLSKTLLGDYVSEDNFPARMAALIKRKKQALGEKLAKGRKDRPMTQGHQRTYTRQFVKNQSCAVYSTGRSPVLEEPSSNRKKSTEAPISSVPEVPPSPVVSSPKSSRTRRKSLGRNRLTKPKSKLKELDLDADAQTFIKVIPTPLGDINALYRIDRSTAYFTTLREILHMVDIQDLLTLYGFVVKYYANHLVIKSWRLYTLSNVHVLETVSGEVVYMFADVPYPLSVKLMERMLTHKLEIDKDVVGNDMTTTEQLIRFIKN
nr:aminoacyl-tRNA synthetase, class 1a, anticodon-binding [Tanacetum cinerariifolium]